MSNKFNVFFEEGAENINISRLQHLASLGLDLAGKRVLEVGAGVGRLTGFFETLNCSILSTDGRPENVEVIRSHYPHRQTAIVDLETAEDLSHLGVFDVIFCYGTLYHLQDPDHALQVLAPLCRELFLLETCVTPGDELAINLAPEDQANPNQALSGTGCRPTRPWIMTTLQKYFGFAYVTTHQPTFPDYDLDWHSGVAKKLHRAVFVGSRQPLNLATLSATLPAKQTYTPESYETWIDVGASIHHGQSTLSKAVHNLALTVYAFESNLHLAANLANVTSNYIVIPAAVSNQDGIGQLCLQSEQSEQTTDASNSVIPVPTVRLDTFIQQQQIQEVNYLKIDTSGSDFEIVRSLGHQLSDCTRIQFNIATNTEPLDGTGVTREAILEYMVQHQFVLIRAVRNEQNQSENMTFVQRSKLLQTLDVADYLETLQAVELAHLATAIASCQPLDRMPGWHFDVDFLRPELSNQARRKIWQHASKHEQLPIEFTWYWNLKLRLYLGNDLSRQLFISGTYDPNEFHLLSQVITAGMTVIDVGANEGLYSLFASHLVNSTGLVLAFEPSQREFTRLSDNLALNQIANVKQFQIGLSNQNTTQTLKIASGEHTGQNTLGDFAYEGVSSVQTETIELRRLDDLLPELGIQHVDVIKLDVEGAEFSVLQGAEATIRQCRPLLVLEVVDQALQNQGSSSTQLRQFLQDLGYKLFVFGEQTGMPVQTTGQYLSNTNVIAVHHERVWPMFSEMEQMEYLQQELEQTQHELAKTQTELQKTRTDFEAQVYILLRKLEEVNNELNQNKQAKEEVQLALEAARNQIVAMESSKFWQFRDRWLNLKRKLGLAVTE